MGGILHHLDHSHELGITQDLVAVLIPSSPLDLGEVNGTRSTSNHLDELTSLFGQLFSGLTNHLRDVVQWDRAILEHITEDALGEVICAFSNHLELSIRHHTLSGVGDAITSLSYGRSSSINLVGRGWIHRSTSSLGADVQTFSQLQLISTTSGDVLKVGVAEDTFLIEELTEHCGIRFKLHPTGELQDGLTSTLRDPTTDEHVITC